MSMGLKVLLAILAGLIAFGVFVSVLATQIAAPTFSTTDFSSVPQGTGASSSAAFAAQRAYCEGLVADGYYEGVATVNNRAWTTSDAPADVCGASQRFNGVVALWGLAPLIITGGFLAAAAFIGYHFVRRYRG